MKTKKIFSFFVCILFLSGVLLAAPPQEQVQKRRLRENIMTLWLLRMTQALDLTEEQTAKIFPAIYRTEKEKREIQKNIGKKMKDLKLALKKEKPNLKELEDMIKELKRLRNLVKSKDEELEGFMEKNLTLIQRARYFIFAVDFARGLKERVDRSRALQERIKRREKRRS